MMMDHEAEAGAALIAAVLISFLIVGIPMMKILNKAGYSRAWILVMFVPLVNLVMLWVFAFAQWPRLSAPAYGQPGAPPYPYPPPPGQPYGQPPYPPQGQYPQQPPYQPPPR